MYHILARRNGIVGKSNQLRLNYLMREMFTRGTLNMVFNVIGYSMSLW